MEKQKYKGIEFEIIIHINGCMKFYSAHEINEKHGFNKAPQFPYISDAIEWKKNLIDKMVVNNNT
jgi:hypothetical protein